MSARRTGARLAALAGVVLALAVAPAATGASRTLDTGFVDPAVLGGADRATWLGRASALGASRIRIAFTWASVAPSRPPAGEGTSAAWSGYNFALVDAQVRSAVDKGLVPMLNPTLSPAWAEGSGRPAGAAAGSWKPDPAAFGQFMQAVAQRYSGRFPDPERPGTALPRVRQFQLWNEPNLDLYLAPQYEARTAFAPGRFRELLNAGYSGVRAAQPTAKVIAGGLAPYGDPGSKATRTRPVAFLRGVLCLDRSLKRSCAAETRVSVVSLHPYAVDRPGRSAYNADDATIPDVGRLTRVLRAARTARTVGPTTPETWVTEFQYESSPPDPKGIPTARRARWTSETLWRLWRAGVPVVLWYLLRDEAPTPAYDRTYQSGFYRLDGRRKGDAEAFRFPVVVSATGKSTYRVWLRTPVAGKPSVQVRRRGRWVTAARTRMLVRSGVAEVRVPRRGVTAVRGVVGGERSIAWSIR